MKHSSNITLIFIHGKNRNFNIQIRKSIFFTLIAIVILAVIGIIVLTSFYANFTSIYFQHKQLSKEHNVQKKTISELNLTLSSIQNDLETIIEKDLEINNILKTHPSSQRYINKKKRQRLYRFNKEIKEKEHSIIERSLYLAQQTSKLKKNYYQVCCF